MSESPSTTTTKRKLNTSSIRDSSSPALNSSSSRSSTMEQTNLVALSPTSSRQKSPANSPLLLLPTPPLLEGPSSKIYHRGGATTSPISATSTPKPRLDLSPNNNNNNNNSNSNNDDGIDDVAVIHDDKKDGSTMARLEEGGNTSISYNEDKNDGEDKMRRRPRDAIDVLRRVLSSTRTASSKAWTRVTSAIGGGGEETTLSPFNPETQTDSSSSSLHSENFLTTRRTEICGPECRSRVRPFLTRILATYKSVTTVVFGNPPRQSRKVAFAILMTGLLYFTLKHFLPHFNIVLIDIGSLERQASKMLLTFLNWIRDHPTRGAIAYIIVYWMTVVLLIPGTPLTLGGGYVYKTMYGWWAGVAMGSIVSILGSLLGSCSCFVLGRYLMRDRVRKWVRNYPLFDAIDVAMADHGFRLMCLLYLTPILPLGPVSYMCGTTSMALPSFAAAKVAALPHFVIYVFLGASTGTLVSKNGKQQQQQQQQFTDLSDINNGSSSENWMMQGGGEQGWMIIVGILISFATMGFISYHVKKELHKILDKQKKEEKEHCCHDDDDNNNNNQATIKQSLDPTSVDFSTKNSSNSSASAPTRHRHRQNQ